MLALSTLVAAACLLSSPVSAQNTTARNLRSQATSVFQPIATDAVPSVIPTTSSLSSKLPPRFVDRAVVGDIPIPTNNWWGNMIGSTTDAEVQPVWSSPYTLRPSLVSGPFGLAVSYAVDHRVFGDTTGNTATANKYFYHGVEHDIIFGASEFSSSPTFSVRGWDDMAVTVRFAPKTRRRLEACGSCVGCLWTYASGTQCFTNAVKESCDAWGAGYTWCTGGTTTTATPTTAAPTTTKPATTTAPPTTTKPATTTTPPATTSPTTPAGTMESVLISGNAYITAKYNQLTPKFSSVHAFTAVNGAGVTTGLQVTGTRFVLTMNNGQKWVLYLSSSATLQFTSGADLVATAKFTGTARVASVRSDAHQTILDDARNCVPEGVTVDAADDSTYSFNFKTSGDCSGGLLHFIQAHQSDVLDTTSATKVSGANTGSATHGPLYGVKTVTTPAVIRMKETTNMPVDFYPPRAALSSETANIKAQLIKDINANWNIPTDGSYYFSGKLAQMYAELCLVANDATITGTDKATLTRTCLNKLETVIAPMVTNAWKYPLQYDTMYRGIISSQGITTGDMGTDFGNTAYNDHHYHYGYWIHAAGILNYLDPSWSQIAAFNKVISSLIRDVANPSTSDKVFPKFRSFDWFRGHSYSHGVTPLGDGKDEESTSEEINFHYGVYLFAKATGNTNLQSVAKLMLKVNTRSINSYFLMQNSNTLQPATIVANKVPGILFDNKMDYATWFSAEKYCIHGIQMIPITPVTEYVRTKTFISEEWSQILSKIPDVVSFNPSNSWLSILYANYATVDKTTALTKLKQAAMDDGLTRTWALYMAATRA